VTDDSANPSTSGSNVFVSYASRDAVDHAATSVGVVTRSHVPGRRRPIRPRRSLSTMKADGLPSHIPDRREAILGGCGENVLFSTLRRMTWESVPSTSLHTCFEPAAYTPRPMTSRAYALGTSTRFTCFPKTARTRFATKGSR